MSITWKKACKQVWKLSFWYRNTTIPIYCYCKLEKDEALDVGYRHSFYGKEELFHREERPEEFKKCRQEDSSNRPIM
jgi:hypothetical protein